MIRQAPGLVNVVRHHHHGITFFETAQQFFDAARRDRIKRCRRFITKQNLRFNRQGTRETETLLLSHRKAGCRRFQAIRHFIPQPNFLQPCAHQCRQLPFVQAMNAWTIGNVVVDRHRQRKRFLRQQANARAHFGDIRCAVVNIGAVEKNLALDAYILLQIKQAVE